MKNYQLIIFANSLDPDQDRQKKKRHVYPDQDPKRLTDSVPERIFWKSLFWKKPTDNNKNMKNYPTCKESSANDPYSIRCTLIETLCAT